MAAGVFCALKKCRRTEGFPEATLPGRLKHMLGADCVALGGAHVPEVAVHSQTITAKTTGKRTYEITEAVAAAVRESGVAAGTVTVFVQHTSCSLIIMENADPTARRDLEAYFDRLVPEDAAYFQHTSEGADDMPSHIRMVLTRTSEVIPIAHGKVQLGTWQGIFLFEHRRTAHQRKIIVTVVGD